MHQKTITALAHDLATKKYSAVELTQYFLDRIKKFNPSLNAFITVTEEAALLTAKKADILRAKNQANILTGIPLAHKDNFYTRDIRTTCASKLLANFIPKDDATVVKLLNQAGMIVLGKTNMDEFAGGSSNETSFFGPAKNPWDLTRVPGGSSGGSASAVSARLTPVATGSDTGGSVRLPAALSGVTGFKPSFGRVSRYGIFPLTTSLDHAGILATCAQDVALILQTIAGLDLQDATSLNAPVPNYLAALNKPLAGLKIGIPEEYLHSNCSKEVLAALQEAISLFEKHGAKITAIRLKYSEFAEATYCIIADAECSIYFSHNATIAANSEDLGQEIKRRMVAGAFMLAGDNYRAYFLQAQKIRRLISMDFASAFKTVDLILGPTAASTAFKAHTKDTNPIKMYLSDMFTVPANLAGLPAISISVGFANGLPLGMQLIGSFLDDATVLNAAHQFQLVTNWHQQLPNLS